MLIEMIGPQERLTVHRHGLAFTWEPQEKYGGAKVLDVTNPDLVREFMASTYGDKPLMRRYELDALTDPDFIRQVTRNPKAAAYILAHPEVYQEHIETIRQEIKEASEDRLRLWASELGLKVQPNMPLHMLVDAMDQYYERRLAPAKPVSKKA